MSNFFSIDSDKTFPFFCEACLMGKPTSEQSPDPRYCLSCFDFLLEEVERDTSRHERQWKPYTSSEDTAHIPNHVRPIMSTPNRKISEVDSFRPRGRPGSYKKHTLPEDTIKQLSKEGLGSKAIATRLKNENGIQVSYKTIQRVLSGIRRHSQDDKEHLERLYV